MKTTKHNLRNLVLVSVAVLFLATAFTAVGTFGQGTIPCPIPKHVTLTAQAPQPASTPYPDFPNGPCSAGLEPNFSGSIRDRCFRHTFELPIPRDFCCQCVESNKNTLTIQYKALQPGPVGSPTSANDTIAFYSNGAVVPGTSQPLYSGPTSQTLTKVIPLKCSWLTNNRLSFLVQDDTSVISAKLDVDLCCVKK